MKKIMRVGLDLAKSVFVVYGVDEHECCQLRKTLRRSELLRFFASLQPCLVGMECGSGAHYWSRQLQALGHDARIMDPRLVGPYRSEGRTGKNDSNDAAAICDPRAKRLTEVKGIGTITASALGATIGNGRDFKNGRQLGTWLGLVPRQHSSGGKNRLGRITKRGDDYLRTLLVHGARSELMYVHRRDDPKSQWALKLREEKSWNKASVALANKHARIAWAILANQH